MAWCTMFMRERTVFKINRYKYCCCFASQKVFPCVFAEAGYLCIPALLPVLKEVAESCVPENNNHVQEDLEDSPTVLLGAVANIFQKIVEHLARRLRKVPEKGKLVSRHTLL